MSQPTVYDRLYNFQTYQASNPAAPYVGSQHDAEFNAVATSVNEIIANLALIQRDDGGLFNGVVTPDSLDTATVNMIGDWNPRGAWVAATNYAVRDMVTPAGGSLTYVCNTAHTSGATFAAGLALGYWQLVNGTGVMPSSGVQFLTNNVILGRVSAGAGAGEEIVCTPFARTLLDDIDAATARTTLGLGTGNNVTFANLTISGQLAVSSLIPFAFLYADAISGIASTPSAPLNGQLLIGSSGVAPVRANLLGTVNQVSVTNGAGSITLGTAQSIGATSSPTFAGLTLTGLSQGSVVFVGGSSLLSQDTANFVWNDATNCLGIGTASPLTQLHVAGAASFFRKVSVQAHGAVGDGVQDETGYINAALAAVGVAGGGAVVLEPNKRYRLGGNAQTITITITGQNTMTASAGTPFTTMGLAVDSLVMFRGFTNAANNTFFRVKTTTGSVLTFDGTPLVNEGPTANVVIVTPLYIPVNVTLCCAENSPISGFTSQTNITGPTPIPYVDTAFMPSTDRVVARYQGYTVNAGADTVIYNDHGFPNDARVGFNDGLNGDLTAAGITQGTRYFVINRTANNFQISLTSGGAAVNITGAPGATAQVFWITSASGFGKNFSSMGGALVIDFDAGRGDGTVTYDVSDVAGLPNYATRTAAIFLAGGIANVAIFQRSYVNGMAALATDNATFNRAYDSGYFASVAIRQCGEDATIRKCFIGGFMQGVLSYLSPRLNVEETLFDCMNAIELSASFDVAKIGRVHAFPFASIGYSLSSLVRRGTFIWAHNDVHWPKLTECFTYGHKNGIYLADGVVNAQIVNCGADNTLLETVGYYGLRLGNNVQSASVNGFKTAAREFGVYIDVGATNEVTLSGISSTSNNTGIHIVSGYRVTASGGYYSAPNTGTRIGVNNVGGLSVVLINPSFVNCVSNQNGCAIYRESFTRRSLTRNQGMTIAQYGSGPVALTNAYAYACVDMWAFRQDTAAAGIAAQVNLPTVFVGLTKAAKMGRTAASASVNPIRAVYCLHSVECAPFAGRTLTISGVLYAGANFSAAAGAVTIQVQSGTGTDQSPTQFSAGFAGSAFPVNTTWPAVIGSNVGFEITFIAPANCNQLGIMVAYTPVGVAGADDNLYFTGIRLENAQQATRYDPMSPAEALAECTDIACKSFILATAPVTNAGVNTGETNFIAGKAGALAEFSHRILFPRRMIAAPTTIYLYNPAVANAQVRDFTAAADCAATATANATDAGFNITCTGAAGTAVGNNLGLHWLATCALGP